MIEYYVECNPDGVLLQHLKISGKLITHCNGSGNIFNKLRKFKNRFALIDEDPKTIEHPYYSSLFLEHEAKGIKVYTDKTRGHRILVLCPRFEEWLIQTAKEKKIKLSDFSLPDNPQFLRSAINSRLKNLQSLLTEIDKHRNSRLDELRRYLPTHD
ncbi:MAG: hypothetical protein HXX16_07100 [Bacteroidales bacterium]|nr:hypothetical protein [Bacteroidales bacterium]